MKITKEKYIEEYSKFEKDNGREPRQSLIDNTFSIFLSAEFRYLIEDEFWRLIYVYSSDNPVTVKLTKSGSTRLYKDVAKAYIEETAKGWTWDKDKDVKEMIDSLEKGTIEEFPPIFLREKFTNEPQDGSFYVEDGIHHSLAIAVYGLKTGSLPKVKAYIGFI